MSDGEDNEPAFEARLMIFGNIKFSVMAENDFNEAQEIIANYNAGELIDPEPKLRHALNMLLNVFWIVKDLRVPISKQMHSIGAALRENYGCALEFKDGFYFTRCPNMLLHLDFGFSMRGFENYKCSICDMDPVDCDHRSGRKYSGVECKKFADRCNICNDEISSCNHHLGETYDDVEAVKLAYVTEIITFDVVKEPECPISRVTKIPFSKQYMVKGLREDPSSEVFVYGSTIVNCDHCVSCSEYDPAANCEPWINR